MDKENIRKSISLIGPSCVGKSLISSELSKKTGFPILCVDDLLLMIEYEKNGYLQPHNDVSQKFAKHIIDELKGSTNMQKIMENEQLKDRQIELIKDVFNLYDSYIDLFRSLKPFYSILESYQERISWAGCTEEKLMNLNSVATEIALMVVRLVDQPLIFDMPASFGWSVSDDESLGYLENGDLKRFGKIDFAKIKIMMDSFLNTTATVLLCPGEDYELRNTVRGSLENQMLLKYLSNYFDNAKISITTNAVFNEPENRFLQKRSWLDAEESLAKDRLKNRAEINNICDQILGMIEELKTEKSI